ncbi:MAG: RNA ligase, partial [Patescibacteria group bacterium]
MLFTDLFSNAELDEMIAQKMITRIQHPTMDLQILDYSKVCQAENIWNKVTINCRGLVVEGSTGKIVARTMIKFFNQGQPDESGLPATIPSHAVGYEKVDGSMISLYNYNGEWMTSTRGSFQSDQAKKAYQMLDEYQENVAKLDPEINYVFEVIYPENRVVVKYTESRLVLLAALSKDASEIEIEQIDWPYKAAKLDQSISADEAKGLDLENEEGFVFRWVNEDGAIGRAKVKF